MSLNSNNKTNSKNSDINEKRKAWQILLVVYLASIAVTMSMMKIPPVMNILLTDLNTTMAVGGFFMSAFMIPGVILAIPVASFLNIYGPKKCGLIALGFTIFGSIFGSLAQGSPILLLIGRLIEGVGFAGIMVVAPSVISMWFEPKKRGLPMGIWATWVPVGMFIIYNLAKPLELAFGWRGIWLFNAFFAFIAFLAFYKIVDYPTVLKNIKIDEKCQNQPQGNLSQGLKNKNIWILTFIFLIFGMTIQSYTTWLPTYLTESGLQPTKANFSASLIPMGMILANIIGGLILIYIKNHKFILIFGLTLNMIALSMWFRLGSVFMVIPWMMAVGISSGLTPPCIFTMAPETVSRAEFVGIALALVNMGFNLGSIIGPPIIGMIVSKGGWAPIEYFVIAPMFIGILIALTINIKEKVIA
jgi:MFS family permease